MRIVKTSALFLAVILTASGVYAIDRSARMIDSAYIESEHLDHGDVLTVNVSVENVTATINENWAIIAGLGLGQIDYDDTAVSTSDLWWGGLGVKWYLFRVTSLSVMGFYKDMEYGSSSDLELSGAKAEFIQRLLPATSAISPFIKGSAAFQQVDHPAGYLGLSQAGKFDEFIFSLGAGCDFMMNDSMAFVFSAGYSESEDVDDGQDTSDGFTAGLAMKYYWD